MSDAAVDALVYATITVVAAINGTSGSLTLTAGLIGLLVWQTARDVEARVFFTPLALALGLAFSLSITIPGVVAGTILDRAQLILPAAILIGLFVYAISFFSIRVAQSSKGTRFEQTTSILVFPFLWTISWAIFCRAHSLGRLVSWTPLREFGAFYPMAAAFGMPGLDFLVALLAITVVELLGGLRYIKPPTSPLIDYEPTERSHLLPPSSIEHAAGTSKRSKFRCILLVSFFFVWWSIAGIVSSNAVTLPSDKEAIKIACVLPHATSINGRTTLVDYMQESERVSGRGAKILQWPESAVRLNTVPDKIEFAAGVKSLATRRKAFIGTSYSFMNEDDPERSSILSTMFGAHEEIVYSYAKQALVPVAETYRYTPGTHLLPRETIFVPESRQTGRTMPHGQNITISSAICHDTSFDYIIRQAYPASLVLVPSVPSSVYSERVAWTRINQLRANARALSTSYLVCDGNSQGISAFIEYSGDVRYWQKGAGSFEISMHANGRPRTAYGTYGDIGSIGILFACLLAFAGLEVLTRHGLGHVRQLYHQAKEAVKHRFGAHYGTNGRVSRGEEDLM